VPALPPALTLRVKTLTAHIEKAVTGLLLLALVGLVAYKFLFPPSVDGGAGGYGGPVRRGGLRGPRVEERVQEAKDRAEALRARVSPKPPTYFEDLARRNPFQELGQVPVEVEPPKAGGDPPVVTVRAARAWKLAGQATVNDQMRFFIELVNTANPRDKTTFNPLTEGSTSRDGRVTLLKVIDGKTVQIQDNDTGQIYELVEGVEVAARGLMPGPAMETPPEGEPEGGETAELGRAIE